MSAASAALEQMKSLVRAKGLEDEFLKSAGLDSLDELSPKNFSELQPSEVKPKTTSSVSVSAEPQPASDLKRSAADAPQKKPAPAASDILTPYLGTKILYASRKRVSSYMPSALMMFHIVHLINVNLVDNFYFKRYCPDYHPYVLRLFYGILFHIQVLRAAHDALQLDHDQHEFLARFLSNFPPDTLPIPGPLIPLFKTICSSQPEITSYGKLFPRLPAQPGPALRSSFVANHNWILFIPQVPAILALLEHLNSLINGETPVYPKKGQHVPVASRAVTFGHHAFPAQATRTALEKWSLVCSGLEYPCEADAKLNEAFAERYDNFDLPTTTDTDDLSTYPGFLSMERQMSWFSTVKDVAAAASLYYEGSGTLADCSPHGLVANQLTVNYSTPATLPTAPTKVADKASRFPFAFRLSTSARALPALTETMASMAQTHIHVFTTHPFAGEFGMGNTITGQFWDIHPIEQSSEDEESFNALPGVVKSMMKSRV
jgi:hypothetical protein